MKDTGTGATFTAAVLFTKKKAKRHIIHCNKTRSINYLVDMHINYLVFFSSTAKQFNSVLCHLFRSVSFSLLLFCKHFISANAQDFSSSTIFGTFKQCHWYISQNVKDRELCRTQNYIPSNRMRNFMMQTVDWTFKYSWKKKRK